MKRGRKAKVTDSVLERLNQQSAVSLAKDIGVTYSAIYIACKKRGLNIKGIRIHAIEIEDKLQIKGGGPGMLSEAGFKEIATYHFDLSNGRRVDITDFSDKDAALNLLSILPEDIKIIALDGLEFEKVKIPRRKKVEIVRRNNKMVLSIP